MSSELNKVINLLQGDISAISSFLSDPEVYLSNFSLTNEEKHALISKNVNALITLGADQELVAGAMSSPWFHSPRCTI